MCSTDALVALAERKIMLIGALRRVSFVVVEDFSA